MRILRFVFLITSLIATQTYAQTLDVTSFGANGNDNIDDTIAINQALSELGILSANLESQGVLDSRSTLYFPPGQYIYNWVKNVDGTPQAQALPVPNNSTLRLADNAEIIFQQNMYMLFEKYSYNIRIVGGIFTGPGQGTENADSRGTGGFYFENGNNIEIIDTEIRETGGIGIYFYGTQNSLVKNVNAHHNWSYGGQNRNGNNNQWIDSKFNNNGLNNPFQGRGLVIWGGNTLVKGNEFIGNSEYGLRIFSAANDTWKNEGIVVSGNILAANWLQDLYLYHEKDLINDIVINNNTILFDPDTPVHSNKPKLPLTFAGKNILFINNQITNTGSNLEYRAMHVTNAQRLTFKDNTVSGFQRGVSFGPNYSSVMGDILSEGHLIEGNEFNPVHMLVHRDAIAASTVRSITIKNNHVTSIAGAPQYVAIEMVSSHNLLLDSNTFNGFYKAVVVNTPSDAIITRNVTVNSLNAGYQAYGTPTNVILHGNQFN